MATGGTTASTRRLGSVHPGDAAAVLAIVLFAVLALALHSSVSGLGDMATGMRDTGTAIQRSGARTAEDLRRSIGRAADSAQGVPLVGGQVAQSVRDVGDTSADAVRRETAIDGAQLVQAGADGHREAQRTATLIGWFAFLVPTILLLAIWVPRRWPAWHRKVERVRSGKRV